MPAPYDCPSCGGKVANLAETISEVLEHVAANFRVIRHVRREFACTQCNAIVQASAPSRAIAWGLAGAGSSPVCCRSSTVTACRNMG